MILQDRWVRDSRIRMGGKIERRKKMCNRLPRSEKIKRRRKRRSEGGLPAGGACEFAPRHGVREKNNEAQEKKKGTEERNAEMKWSR